MNRVGRNLKLSSSAASTGGAGRSLGLAFLLACLLALSCGAAAASASNSFRPAGGLGDGTVGVPARLAVEESTGNVLVVDSANNKVEVFDSTGPGASLLTSFGEGELSSPYGIAIDQSNGDVYVTDAGNSRVLRYETDGADPPTYTLDSGYTGPAAGGGSEEVGSFASAIAVDPTNGDLLVADRGNNRVSRFDDTGAFVSSFDGADSPAGAFTHLEDIAFSPSGLIFVTDSGAPEAMSGGASRVLRFSGAGVYAATLRGPAVNGDAYLAYDSAHEELIVGDARECFFCKVKFHILDPVTGATVFDVEVPSESITGLAVDPGAKRLYAASARGEFFQPANVQVFEAQTHPDLVLDPPSAIGSTSVHLSGTVDPNGVATTYHFEVSNDNGGTWTSTAELSAGSGEDPVAVEADVEGLEPNKPYLARLVAANAEVPGDTTAPRSFKTLVHVPDVVTGSATNPTASSVTLRGTINPLGAQTTYHFEYGTTTTYGSRVPLPVDAVAGQGRSPLKVAEDVSGLQPGTTYHYRLVGSNSAGDEFGEDKTFTTQIAEAPTRPYELVSPPEKGGSNVLIGEVSYAGASGDFLSYAGQNVFAGTGTEASPYFPRYISRRTESGWSTKAVDPAQGGPRDEATGQFIFTLGVSEDGTKAVVISDKKLAPGGEDGGSNVYLRDLASGAFTTLATVPGNDFWVSVTGFPCCSPTGLVRGTPNFDHILLWGPNVSFLPGAPASALYEWSDGQLKVVSVLPDGSPTTSNLGSGIDRETVRITPDGQRIFFESSETHAVYTRADGVTTVMSESQRAEDAGTIFPGRFVGASRDGHVAYFFSENLTEDSPPTVLCLYRYTIATGTLEMLEPVSGTDGQGGFGAQPMQVSETGGTVSFLSRRALTPGAADDVTNVYILRNGHLSLVGALNIVDGFNPPAWQSPNGRYFALAARTRLTDYDPTSPACHDVTNGGQIPCTQVYLYDADAETLTCVSCRPDGGVATGAASIGPAFDEWSQEQIVRAVDDEGSVFFDSPEQLVSRDVNSAKDVYEFHGGTVRLISTGQGSKALIAGVGGEGRDVFFTTQDRLVKADIDTSVDAYDARVGGGIPSQNAETPSPDCAGEDCRGQAPPPPAPPPGGSETTFGPGNQKASGKKGCPKGKHRKKVKGKPRCVKNHKKHKGSHQAKKRTNNDRRQGR